MVLLSFCGKTKRLDEDVTLVNLYILARSLFALDGITFEIFCDKELVTEKHLDDANQNLRIVASDSALMQLEKQAHDIHDMKWELVREQFAKLREEITDLRTQNQNLESRHRMLEDGLNYERLTRQSRAEDLEERLTSADLEHRLTHEKFAESVEERFLNIDAKLEDNVSSIEQSIEETRQADEEFRHQVSEGMRQFQNNISEHHELMSTSISCVKVECDKKHATALEVAVERSGGEAARMEDLLKRDTAKIQASLLNLRHDLNALTETSKNEFAKLEKEDFMLTEKISKVEEHQTTYESVCTTSANELAQTIDRLEEKLQECHKKFAANLEQVDTEWHAEANRIVDDVALKLDTVTLRFMNTIEQNVHRFAALEPISVELQEKVTTTQRDVIALQERLEASLTQAHTEVNRLSGALSQQHSELLKELSQFDGRLDITGVNLSAIKNDISSQMMFELKRVNEDLANRISRESAARTESMTSQQTWVKLWSDEFRSMYDQKSDESEKKASNVFQEVSAKVDTLTASSDRQMRQLREGMEKETLRIEGFFEEMRKELHSRYEHLNGKLDDSTQHLEDESRSRWNQAALSIDESSKRQRTTDSKIADMDEMLAKVAHDMSIVRKHIPVVFALN